MELFENDFIKFSWSGESERQSPGDEFEIRYMPCSRTPNDFKTECEYVAKRLVDLAQGEKIRVLLSGGVDSEAVCRVFQGIGHPFEAVTMKYKRFVWHEINHAKEYCQYYNIPHEIIEIDEDDFFSNEINQYIEKYKLNDPYVAFDIKRFEVTGGFPVFGTGDLVLELNEESGEIYSKETGSLNIPRIFQRQTETKGCYQFFQFTPEIMLSYLRHPMIQKWIELAPQFKFEDVRYFKHYMYKSYWPDIKPRHKYYGYERFADKYYGLKTRLDQKYGYQREFVDIPLNQLVEQLSPN